MSITFSCLAFLHTVWYTSCVGKLVVIAAIAGVVLFYLLLLLGGVVLMLKLFRDHNQAKEYRKLLAEYERLKHAPVNHGPSYKMVYKNGKKTETVILPGKTEAEALAAAATRKVSWTAIVSLDKVS